MGRSWLLEDEGNAAAVVEAFNDVAVERRGLEGERVQVLARPGAWEVHRVAGERLAPEALGACHRGHGERHPEVRDPDGA